ncbi:MAG: PTS sugar transporter subunit IIA [Planctomycetaceae bacterium]
MDKLLTLREVADVLQVNERTALRLAHTGELPARRVGSQWRVHPLELERWFADGRRATAVEAPRQAPAPLFDASRVLLSHPATTVCEAFEAVAELLAMQGHLLYPRLYVEALLAREAKMSTGIGDGVAIPHARSEINSLFRAPLCVLLRPLVPLDFQAVDAKPVDLVFVLAAPTDSSHLASLAALMRHAREPSRRERLRRARDSAEAAALLGREPRANGRA